YGETVILQDVSFTVAEGERFVILGGSGCGKSTLLRHLIGLQPPLAGTIRLRGVDITRADDTARRAVLRNIGVLFQGGALFSSMTVAENIALPLENATDLSRSQIEDLVRIKLSLVGLAGFENHYPGELSGGMRKRAGLARALALNPAILFFDEPSAGLDPLTSAELDELIIALNQTLHTTMVIVTHELASIFAIAQRVIMLDKGSRTIIASGDPHWLRDHHKNPWVQNFFNRRPSSAS
ncbi:MAG TPA: ATP-binding cassette domain-containing protein, partial [Desulfobacterales bacterium]|nr:ATP-binding cassette domain-containing protein [Desulfobacterales bacterium]